LSLIIVNVDERVVDFEHVFHLSPELNNADDTLRLTLHAMRFVHWQARTETLLSTLWYVLANLGQEQQETQLPQLELEQQQQQQHTIVAKRPFRFTMQFDNPTIVVPPNRATCEGEAFDAHLLLDLGRIHFSNCAAMEAASSGDVDVSDEARVDPSRHRFAVQRTAGASRLSRPVVRCDDTSARRSESIDAIPLFANDNNNNDNDDDIDDDDDDDKEAACERSILTFESLCVKVVGREGASTLVPHVDATLHFDSAMPAPLPAQSWRADVSDVILRLDQRHTDVLADVMRHNMASTLSGDKFLQPPIDHNDHNPQPPEQHQQQQQQQQQQLRKTFRQFTGALSSVQLQLFESITINEHHIDNNNNNDNDDDDDEDEEDQLKNLKFVVRLENWQMLFLQTTSNAILR
jgi:hypothetical protein